MSATAESSLRKALVFDIETIAGLTPENRDAIAALATERDTTPEEYGSLCPPLARVVCISWLDVVAQELGAVFDATLCAGDPPPSVQLADGYSVLGAPGICTLRGCDGEQEVLRQFGCRVEQHLQQANAQLVTYNGRGFDLPVLVHRSIMHDVTEGRALLARAATENRYRPLMHIDLMDIVTFFGASPRWPMAAYAVGYGFRSPKSDMSGAQVCNAVQNGRIIDVVRYCAGDVLATAHVHYAVRGLLPTVSPESS